MRIASRDHCPCLKPQASSTARALTLAGLTLIDPRGLTGWRRAAYTAAVGAVSGWALWDELGRDVPDYAALGLSQTPTRASLAAGAAGVAVALTPLGIAADTKLTSALRRLRVPAPRVWLAALTFAASKLADRLPVPDPSFAGEGEDDEQPLLPLDDRIRDIAGKILSVTEDWGAPQLRAQLASASQVGPAEPFDVGLAPAGDAPLSAADYYTFPFVGRYDADGTTVEITLHVSSGRLAWIVQEIPEGVETQLTGWPDADRVEVVTYTHPE
ncbi:MAG: hypothetical protein Q3997_08805 [Propionibacteriaceae bacterium]|nr:hypothetical protein [Propionibacteriaceae bacterium]